MSRKFLSLALSIALLLTLLGSIPAMAEEPVTVTWYGVGASSDHQARINEAASKYIQSRGVNANLEIIKLGWGDYLQTYQIMLAAHEEFDLFNGQGSTFMQYAANGGIVEITDEILQEKLPGVTAAASEALLSALRYQGKLYMVPAMHEWAQYYGFAYYNVDVVEALGLDLSAVKCLDDLDPILEQVHEAYPDYTAVLPVAGIELPMMEYGFDTLNHQQTMVVGIDTNKENAEIISYYESEEVIDVLHKIDEWGHKGYLNQDPTIASMSIIQSGKLFTGLGRFKPGTGAQYTTDIVRYDEMAWDPNAAPKLSFQDSPAGWCTAVSSTCSDIDTALAVLNMTYTDADLVNLIVFGEKDVDYTLNENGFVEFIPGGYTELTASHTWQFGNQSLDYITQTQASMGLEDIWEIQAAFNLAAVPVQCAGFFFNTDEVDIEIAALNNVYEEYGAMLWNGMCDDVDATLAEFVKKLYDNGLQAVLNEANRQYADFLASK